MKKSLLLLVLFLCTYLATYSQFDTATVSAYFTEHFEVVELDSAMIEELGSTFTMRKVEVKIENLDSLDVHGCIIEVLEVGSDYIISRKIGNKYKEGTMEFVRFENGIYYLDAGYFREDAEIEVLIRLEDYKKAYSDLFTLTALPYEE